MVVPTFLTMKIFSVYRHQKEDNFTRGVQLAPPIKKATLDLKRLTIQLQKML